MSETSFSAPESQPGNDVPVDIIVAGDITDHARRIFEAYTIEGSGFDNLESAGIDKLFELTHANGDKTIFVTYTPEDHVGTTELRTVLVDLASDDRVTGSGYIRFFEKHANPNLVNTPFVGYTKTQNDFRRQGLARRRLMTMNAIAEGLHGTPLRSGTHQDPEATMLWEKLLREGKAIKLSDGEFPYRLKSMDSL